MNAVLIIARALHFGALISLVGLFTFNVFVASPAGVTASAQATLRVDVLRARRVLLARYSLGIALLSGLLWLFSEAVVMSGQSVIEVLSGHGLVTTVLLQTRFGRNWDLRFVLLLFVAVLMLMRSLASRNQAVYRKMVLPLSAIALVTIAGAGHAADMRGWSGDVHVIADGAHLLAAGVWLGALIPLALLLNAMRSIDDPSAMRVAHISLLRFSALGLIAVGTLVVTGLVNAWFLVGGVHALVGTLYGRLLLIKLALFSVMASLAVVNRTMLTPQVAGNPGANRPALARLQRNATIEVVLGVLILMIVGAMGITPPATQAMSMIR